MEGILFLIGGWIYIWMEMVWRGRTHWTMFLLGGLCFVVVGLLNEHYYKWNQSLLFQSVVGAVIITAMEFITGCVVNIWLEWNVWDYSNLPFNLMGQICLYFFLLWIPIAMLCIVLDDWIRYLFYLVLKRFLPEMQIRQRPRYYLWGKEGYRCI